jgi:hypothetical protein
MSVNPDMALWITVLICYAVTMFRIGYGGKMPSPVSLVMLLVMLVAAVRGAL